MPEITLPTPGETEDWGDDLNTAITEINNAVDAKATAAQGAKADSAVQPSVIDAKGDLLVGTADNTVGRLPAGTDGQTIVYDSGEATGMRPADFPSGGGGGVTPSVVPEVGGVVGPYGLFANAGNTNQFGTAHFSSAGCMYVIPSTITIDRLFCDVDTADASATLALGLWSGDPDTNLPDEYVGGASGTPSSTGVFAVTVDIELQPGIYWGSLAASSNATLRVQGGRTIMGNIFYNGGLSDLVFHPNPRWKATAGTWDAPANVSAWGWGMPDWTPLVGMRRSA